MTFKTSVLRNVAWVALAGYIESAVGLLAGVLIARTLGPSEYGHYAFAVWCCGMLIMAGNHALPTSSVKFIAEARGAAQEELHSALASRFMRLQMKSTVLVLGAFCIVMVIDPLDDWGEQLPIVLTLAVIAVWARAGFWMRGGIAKGHERFGPENLSLAMTALANGAGVIALALAGATRMQFFALYAALGVLSYLLVRWNSVRHGVRMVPGPIPAGLAQRMRRHLALTGVIMLLALATNRAVEMTLLKSFAGAETVAYFAIAGSLTKGAMDLLAGGLSAVLLPVMARRFGAGGRGALNSLVIDSARLYWFVGLAVAGLGLTVCDGLVHLLYGQRYNGAIPVLMWNLVIAGLTAVTGAANAALAASDHQHDRVKVLGCALIVNVAAGAWLIPRYGLPGAIASLAMTHAVDMALSWAFARHRIRMRLPAGPMARQALAAAVATGLGVLVVQELHLSLAFLGGAMTFLVVYVPLCVVWRTMRGAEFQVFAQLVRRLGPRAAGLSTRVARLERFAMDAHDAPATPV